MLVEEKLGLTSLVSVELYHCILILKSHTISPLRFQTVCSTVFIQQFIYVLNINRKDDKVKH